MRRASALLVIVGMLLPQSLLAEEVESKTVIGPRNVFLYDGAQALREGDGETGVRLTQQGLAFASGRREKIAAHSNLCAGFTMLRQAETALQHCDWVLDEDPEHWRTYNNRALAYLQLERYEESEADVKRGQELNPRSEKLKEVKGMLLDEVDPVSERISIDDRRGESPPVITPPESGPPEK